MYQLEFPNSRPDFWFRLAVGVALFLVGALLVASPSAAVTEQINQGESSTMTADVFVNDEIVPGSLAVAAGPADVCKPYRPVVVNRSNES